MPGTSVLVTEIEIHRLKDCEVLDLTISTLPNAASVDVTTVTSWNWAEDYLD